MEIFCDLRFHEVLQTTILRQIAKSYLPDDCYL